MVEATAENNKAPASELSDADFERFRDFFYRRTGIYFENSKRYFVDKRLLERMRTTGHEDFRSYFASLRFQASDDEFQHVVNAMTVNETYFMREKYQFECLVDEMLDEIVARNGSKKTIRIWSIPSSSGEEPYSLALMLLSHWSSIESIDIEIVASDIDTAALNRAREGIYGDRALQYVSASMKDQYFERLGEGRWQINREIREAISFTRLNLADASQTRQYRDFDVIFCRNLLIYFDDAARRRAAEVFFEALNDGGFICLGHSESMSRISSSFRVRKFKNALVYQKPWADNGKHTP